MKQKELLELIVNLMENGMSSGKVINALEKDRHSHKYGEKLRKYIEENNDFSLSLLLVLSELKGKKHLVSRYTTLLKASEETGNLKEGLNCILRYLVEKENTKSRFLASLLYPFFIVLIAMAGGFVLLHETPRFLMYTNFQNYPQLKTAMKTATAALFLIISVISALLVFIRNREAFQSAFFKNIQIFTSSGLPMDKALRLTTSSLHKGKKKALLILEKVRKGDSFYDACKDSNYFDSLTETWLCYGEESGDCKEAFVVISKHYAEKQKKQNETIQALMEPLGNTVAGLYLLVIMTQVALPVLKELIFII